MLEVAEDRPQVIVRDLRDDIVIPVDTLVLEDNLDNARFIDDRIWMTVNDIKIAMKDGKFKEMDENTIRGWTSRQLSGANRQPFASVDELVLLHEVCVWYDVNGDGIEERCIITYPDSNPSEVLRFIELPYDHGQWPYTLVKREFNDPGVYTSRGIPALEEDYQVGISTALNQAVDNGTIVNTPQVVAKRNILTNIKNQRYVPGEYVEVNGDINQYQIRQNANFSQHTLFQQAQYLKSWSDQRIGNITAGLSTANNLPGMGEGGRKTKAEIDLISNLQGETQSLDLQIFQMQMARVYYQIDSLYEQFGNWEEVISLTGMPPLKITRKEIQGKYNMIPNGRLENTNPAFRAQKAYNLMRIFGSLNPAGADPDIRQYELKKIFLNDFDPRIAGKLLMTEEEIVQNNKLRALQQEISQKRMLGEQIELSRIMNALDVEKELVMVDIHGKKYAPD